MICFEARCANMEGHAETVAERLQISGVGLIMDILHADMQGFDGEVGDMNLGTACEELQQTEGVLATRQTDEDAVVLVDKLELSQRFIESLPKSFVKRHLLHENQIDGADNEKECQDVVPVQMSALKHDIGNNAEYSQRDAFLNNLQLYEVEGSAVLDEA